MLMTQYGPRISLLKGLIEHKFDPKTQEIIKMRD